MKIISKIVGGTVVELEWKDLKNSNNSNFALGLIETREDIKVLTHKFNKYYLNGKRFNYQDLADDCIIEVRYEERIKAQQTK